MQSQELDLDKVLNLIKEKGYQLNFTLDIPDQLKSNKQVIEAVLEHSRFDVEMLTEASKNDLDIMLLVAEKKSYCFKDFPDWAKNNKQIALAAIKDSADAFEYASQVLRSDKEVVLTALNSNSAMYNTMSFVMSEEITNDIEVIKAAIKSHNQAFSYIPDKWKSNKEILDLVISAEISDSSFEHFPESYRDDKNVALKAVKDDAGCSRYLSMRLKDDKELALIAINDRGIYLEEFSERVRDDKEVVLKALKNDTWRCLSSVSDRLKSDIDVVIAAVSYDNRTLSEFPKEFADDQRVIDACMALRKSGFSGDDYRQGSAYTYFSDRFKNNRDVALIMSSGVGFSLESCPNEFKADKEIVKNAIKVEYSNFQFIDKNLLNDANYIRALYTENDSIISYMDEDLKRQLFSSKIVSKTHRGKELICEIVLDEGSVKDQQRQASRSYILENGKEILSIDNFPVLTYEEDGPVGSYLSVRYINSIAVVGDFMFFIKTNSGDETFEKSFSVNKKYQGYGPEPQATDDFLKHQVYLIPETVSHLVYNKLDNCPRIYFGRQQYLPKGMQSFYNEDDYRNACTFIQQSSAETNKYFTKINESTLENNNDIVDEVFGAARVYIEGKGWRFLIPNKEGVLKSLEVLNQTDDQDDLNWIKSNDLSKLNEHQLKLLRIHFGEDL